MGTPFKMKGFSGFKESPVKGKGDNLKRIMTENKDAAKKAGTWYKPGADPSGMPKDFNIKGDPSTTPKYKSKGNFNFTGDSKSTTPKYSTTKAARVKAHDAAINRLSTNPKTANLPKKEFDKMLDKTSKSFTKPSKVGKFLGSKTLGVLGMMGAGTLSASATPTSKQGKKGSYTSDIQNIIPKSKKKSIWDNKKQIVKR